MALSTYTTLAISFLSDFLISGGGALMTSMVATGQTSMPSTATILFAVITGLVAAARRVQALLSPAVTK